MMMMLMMMMMMRCVLCSYFLIGCWVTLYFWCFV